MRGGGRPRRIGSLALSIRPCPSTTGPARSARRPAGWRSTTAGDEVVVDPRRRGRRVQPRLHLPQGARRSSSCTRTPTGCARRWSGATASCVEATWDEAFEEIERRPRRRSSSSTAATPSRSTSATRPPTTCRRCSTGRSAAGARHRRTSTRPAPSTRCRSRSRAGLMFGTRCSMPGARRRPHRLPADPGREPVRVERQPDDRARHARPARGAPRARRQGRRGRPAPQRARPRRPTSTSPSGPAPTRCCCSRWRARCSRRASSTSARWPAHVNGARRGRASSCASFTPEAVAPRLRHRRRRRSGASPASWRRAERPPSTAASAPAPQEFGTLASWLVDVVNVAHRQPRPRGRRDVPARRGRPAEHARHARQRQGLRASGRWHSRVRGLPRGLGELPVAVPGRGDRHARRGPGPRARSPSPATRCSRRPNGDRLDGALEALEFMVASTST